MFRKLIDKLKSLSTEDGERFDPATLDDPVALITEWTPLKRGGASFCTRQLVRISPLRYEFRASWGAKAFYLIFLVIGLGLLVMSISQVIMGGTVFTEDVIGLGAVGLVFSVVGGLMFYFGIRPVVFDKQHNCFWKGKISADELIYATANELLMPFQEIHSIQLISETISNKNGSYFSYEMNLVSQEGVRTNVVDHGKLDQIHEDARTLSEFLEVPIWDGI
ncbi:hypothetical protein [uncultured Gimesia sp.]|uniref:hypothetical protein n=1 Tax=uncultured Gimesia sp. TaxID=1678688 RepID=UPI0030DB7E3C|tara:strand:- start:8762 stop:9424 length:663 start_codon:yes stop_codon:yes gene_type:complete